MSKLLGHVDRVDQFLVAGWALVDDDPAQYPEVKFVQQGRVLITLRPAFRAPSVRKTLGLVQGSAPPMYAWRLWFPLSNGIKPEIPFSILFSDDDSALALGVDRKIDLYRGIDQAAAADLQDETFFFPVLERDGDKIKVWVRAAGPATIAPPAKLTIAVNRTHETLNLTRDSFIFGKPVYAGYLESDVGRLLRTSRQPVSIGPTTDNSAATRTSFHNSLRTLWVPTTIVGGVDLVAPVPQQQNIERVSGSASSADQYLSGGLTTFVQLDSIARRYFGRAMAEFPMVVDWGVGCARVMRHFFEGPHAQPNDAQTVLGVDIDRTNIDWCRANMNGLGRYELLDFDGFRIDSNSVDFVYGVSVLTHLTEFHQHLWLAEIARILKPGGCAVLTTHGEYVVYGEHVTTGVVGIMTPFVDKFGFFDGIPDNAIGAQLDTYYRATYHSRSYLAANWSRYLEIVDIIPAANAFRQDFVVLRSPVRN